jgi:hypothetical protein
VLERWKKCASRYPFYASSQRKVVGICDMPSADPYAPRRFLEAQVSSRHDQSALTSRLVLKPSLGAFPQHGLDARLHSAILAV